MLDNMPVDTPIYLIDDHHNLYLGTMLVINHELQRGELIYDYSCGGEDDFYRNAIVAWAVNPDSTDMNAKRVKDLI